MPILMLLEVHGGIFIALSSMARNREKNTFADRLRVKIVIGITHNPESISAIVSHYHGNHESLTEVGPFLSKEEALAWRDSLKSKIGDVDEVPLEIEYIEDAMLYGFTFEKMV